jgi:integrase/recombinase XerD
MRLLACIETYVERKRSAGFDFSKAESTLQAFSRQIGDVPVGHVNQRQVAGFLSGPKTKVPAWRQKFGVLRNFFEYWAARGQLDTLPMPPPLPPQPCTFVPYIYSQTELLHLVKLTRSSQKLSTCAIDARTLRTLLLFLYGTGALIGEAVRLERKHVDLKDCRVTLPNGRFDRVRTIPICPDLQGVLGKYARSIQGARIQSSRFFLTRDGNGLSYVTVCKSFQRLRKLAGVRRIDGACYQPRMHDLRSTFAVHRLTSWIKQRADLNRMLPALATYMGQVGLGSTERYLAMTPERFRYQLAKLSPRRRKRRWRDNPNLMKFLVEL